jgi:hypothetical protein
MMTGRSKFWAGVVSGAFALLVASPFASAQIGLPPVRVPDLPIQAPVDLNRTVDGVLSASDPRQLRELRRLRIRDLLRTNRAVLEADPQGAPMVRSEVTAFSPSPEAMDRARAAGFAVARTRTLDGLDATIVVLSAPAGMSTRRALQLLRQADPQGVYDFNHVYLESGEALSPTGLTFDAPVAAGRGAPSGIKVGLIDGGVHKSHSAFKDTLIHEHGCGTANVATAHGTAVASLMVGRATGFSGAAPGAELYSADVYCGIATGGALDAIADAFAWLSRERVPVINVSLVGPANTLLEQVIRIVTMRGHIVVAAVGNDGPSARPLYPAAYPAVVAVTGVDVRNRVLLEACRGKHVDFAAPGADMSAATVEEAYGQVRGTSFAAPIVTGLLAMQMHHVDKHSADAAIASLLPQAIDLGARGSDKIYGNGLVGETLRTPLGLASVRAH